MNKTHADWCSRLEAELTESSVARPRNLTYRPSSFPICGRLKAIERARTLALREPPRQRETFRNDTYLSVGTALHACWQRWLGRIGVLWGDWACQKVSSSRDGNVETRLHCGGQARGWGPAMCPNCGGEMEYAEISFQNHKSIPKAIRPVSAHCDGFTFIGDGKGAPKDGAEGGHSPDTVIEIKTTSKSHADSKSHEPKSTSHLMQASAYAQMAKMAYGLDIKHILYVYVNRDVPWKATIFRYSPDLDGSLLPNQASAFKAGNSYGDSHWDLPTGTCSSAEDAEGFWGYGVQWAACPERAVCFGDRGDGGLAKGDSSRLDAILRQIGDGGGQGGRERPEKGPVGPAKRSFRRSGKSGW